MRNVSKLVENNSYHSNDRVGIGEYSEGTTKKNIDYDVFKKDMYPMKRASFEKIKYVRK
jgi:hypothetical protein